MAVSSAYAHDKPMIAVQPSVVAAGEAITVTGTEMEPGEVFALSLEGPAVGISLGEATATDEGEEAGFSVTLSIPAETLQGSYTVQAATEEGETAVADLTITAPADTASADALAIQEPSCELHELDRSKPTFLVMGVILAIGMSSALGIWLIRR